MPTSQRACLALLLAFCVTVGWHLILFNVPHDGFTGNTITATGQFSLLAHAPPNTRWAENGISTYSYILRVDAQDVSLWLDRALSWDSPASTGTTTAWTTGETHQYLTERRDGDGLRVVKSTLQLPSLRDWLSQLGTNGVASLVALLACLLVMRRLPTNRTIVPFTVIACGMLLGIAWGTFALPFSYIPLRWPFWGQLGIHIIASALIWGATVQLACVFLVPIPAYVRYQRAILPVIYGLYPLGALCILFLMPTATGKIAGIFSWEQYVAILLKGAAYLAWASQYRRVTIRERAQLHWVFAALAASDLPFLLQMISDNQVLSSLQIWLAVLPPIGYMVALLPTKYLRLRLEPSAGVIHTIANALTGALFLAGLGLAINVLIGIGRPDSIPLVTGALALLFALATAPLWSLLREYLDRWFNATRGTQRAILAQFIAQISTRIELDSVIDAYRTAVEQAVQPSSMALWLWDAETKTLQAAIHGANIPPVIPLSAETQALLSRQSGFVADGQLRFWAEGLAYVGTVVLVASDTIVGVCAIGPQIDDSRYSKELLQFLETLSRSATLALYNAQLIAQLKDKIVALRSAYQQFISAQETERQNLAAELHDETLQQLAYANLMTAQLRQITHNGAVDIVKDLQHSISLTERRLREILRGIHPAVLTDLGLVAALESWLPSHTPTTIRLSNVGFAERRLPDPQLEISLYRLAQESINNALKHAQAEHIDVRLIWQDTMITLEVEDDGIGFIPALHFAALQHNNHRLGDTADKHYGLLNLRERVNALGGTLTIDSQVGKGTIVRVTLRTDAVQLEHNR